MSKLLIIALGGALGTVMRYGFSGLIHRFAGAVFPWGTFGVNAAGSLVIGFLWAVFETVVVPPNLRSFALVGVLGGFTTFSTFSLETFNLLRDNEFKLAFSNVLFSTLAGLTMVYAGYVAGKYLIMIARR